MHYDSYLYLRIFTICFAARDSALPMLCVDLLIYPGDLKHWKGENYRNKWRQEPQDIISAGAFQHFLRSVPESNRANQ